MESKIRWYRSQVDRKVMSDLMQTSDLRGFCQVIPQLGLFVLTGTLAYLAFLQVHEDNWPRTLPVLLVALFIHGTFSSFLGLGGPVHELSHKTPFRTKAWNEIFLKVYSFLSWSDWVGFRPSHVKHHQVTVHHDLDGEVVLPQALDWSSVKFGLSQFICNPVAVYRHLRGWVWAARGDLRDWVFKKDWMEKVLPQSNVELRGEHRRWARILLGVHIGLAILFVATGHWFLVVIVNLGCFYSGWLVMLCGTPQHIGMAPDVPDFRLCCRTYTCAWLPAFLYWNMQYHVEHHMFPAVPFYNLPKLRKILEHDLPPAPHGLWATWKEIVVILKKQKEDPHYVFVPTLPQGQGERVEDVVLESEAADRLSPDGVGQIRLPTSFD